MTECRRVEYSGRVQGVGFRYTVLRLAKNHAVQGYVKNLANGHVEVVAEGTTAEIDAFLRGIERVMAGYVEESRVETVPVQGFTDFRVAY